MRRNAFTLIELMVTLAIIGVLVALLLPAIQSTRESARCYHCRNNLKQIGLALHNYHDQFQVFPMGCGLSGLKANPGQYVNWTNGTGATAFGWTAAILPQLDQANLFFLLDVDRSQLWQVISEKETQTTAQSQLLVMSCPSGSTGLLNMKRRFTLPDGKLIAVALANYPANSGTV